MGFADGWRWGLFAARGVAVVVGGARSFNGERVLLLCSVLASPCMLVRAAPKSTVASTRASACANNKTHVYHG